MDSRHCGSGKKLFLLGCEGTDQSLQPPIRACWQAGNNCCTHLAGQA